MSFFEQLQSLNEESDGSDEDFEYSSENSNSEEKELDIKIKTSIKGNSKKLLRELNNEYKDSISNTRKKELSENDLVELASSILNAKSSNTKKVMFAGISYEVNQDGDLIPTNSKKSIEQEINERERKLSVISDLNGDSIDKAEKDHKKRFQYANKVLEMLKNKARTITSISKSKLDWKSFVKENKMEKALDNNRKGGYLENQKFLKSMEEKVKQNQSSQRKKVKTK